MKRILLALSLLAAASMAQAQSYTSSLNGPNAGNSTTGTGFGTLTLTGNLLSYDVTYTGLTGSPSAAHVHHGGGINGVTSITPFGTLTAASGRYQGTMTLTPIQTADLVAQTSYLNIHTPTFGGGEIRGDIVVVPEPSTIGLLGAAGLLLAWRKFRARA